MVWLPTAAAPPRFLVVTALAYLVGIADFSHVIAGSVEVFFAVIYGSVSAAGYLANFLVPVFLGNTVGGVVLVALVNHAQTRREL